MTAMTATPLAAAAIAQLEAEGVDTVIGTVINPAGLALAKTVPVRRTNTFAYPASVPVRRGTASPWTKAVSRSVMKWASSATNACVSTCPPYGQ